MRPGVAITSLDRFGLATSRAKIGEMSAPIPPWEPLSEPVLQDQLGTYDRMRASCPMARSPRGVTLFRHADVVATAADPGTFSSAASSRRMVPNSLDPPEHTAFRAIIDPFFAAERVRAFEPRIRAIAHDVIHSLPRGATVDAVREIGYPFAVRAQADWLGWQGIEDELLAWMDANHAATRSGDPARTAAVAAAFDEMILAQLSRRRRDAATAQASNPPDDSRERDAAHAAFSPDDSSELPAATRESSAADSGTQRGTVRPAISPHDSNKRAATEASSPPDDPTTELMHLAVAGRPLTDAEIVSILRNWTAGDLGSIAAAFGVIVYFLATHPEVQSALRDERSDPVAAVDEILRIDDPFLVNRRVTTSATQIAGFAIERGTRIYLNWASANRDERVFPNPDAYRPEEHAPHNVVYGSGIHSCPGRPLATLELVAIMQTLLRQTSRVELAEDVAPERETYPLGGWRRVPVRLL